MRPATNHTLRDSGVSGYTIPYTPQHHEPEPVDDDGFSRVVTVVVAVVVVVVVSVVWLGDRFRLHRMFKEVATLVLGFIGVS